MINFENDQIFEILQFEKLTNFQNFTISKTIENSKIGKFWHCSFVRYSAPLVIFPILIFAIYK